MQINTGGHHKEDSRKNVQTSLLNWRKAWQTQWHDINSIRNERRERQSERWENFRKELHNRFENIHFHLAGAPAGYYTSHTFPD